MGTNEKGPTRALGTAFRRRAAALASCAALSLCAEAQAAPPAGGAAPPPVVPGALPAAPRAPAEPATPPRPPAAAPLSPGAKRPVPDYDGRPDEATSAGDALLWVPRVVFFPAYLASEYLVRRPLGALTVAAEQGEWIKELKDIFTFGPNNDIGIVPTALFDFGFRASVGVYFFYDDLFVPGNELRVHAATGGVDWWRLTLADRIPLGGRAHLKLRGEADIRPDWLFSGIGPSSLERDWARYRARSVEGTATLHADFGAFSFVEAITGAKTVDFHDICCKPTVGFRVARGRYPMPPSYDTGYTAYRIGGRAGLDSRLPRPARGNGVRLELSGEHAADLERPLESRWIRYGGSLGGFVDLTGHDRIVSLVLSAAFADPLGAAEVPFTELAELGGDAPMRGFREGRLRGRSAAAATLEYRYPVWAFVDGTVQVAAGNVFGEHLRDFDLDLLRMSFVLGLRTSGERDHSIDLLIGSATETFEQGAGLQELRFMVGATHGF
ncbi:BamA/TamA family outer membrane protein [Sorangium cellulosum]|uniref:BamA/TamA family outer membrane protein n=1 Tax=Sorangium cellulosum TaxID=56 RepID=UPI0012FF63D5|nr:BamA/TamA family outer membrane protein [Sorangium cellulosum]